MSELLCNENLKTQSAVLDSPIVSFKVALLSGALAGTTVDAALFPLDTVKTRLQSHVGFLKAGGFNRIYSGVAPVLLGSAPTAAVFFCVYEPTKNFLRHQYGDQYQSIYQMFAAAIGETAACTVRVPVEVIKQRAQASTSKPIALLSDTIKHEGIRGMYRGFFSTVIREIPFSFLEMPLWEFFKVKLAHWQGKKVEPWQSGLCGALAGAIAGGITTPLDVAKTRIMLAKKDTIVANGKIRVALKYVYMERGFTGLFAGLMPRMLTISIGGAIFLGIYDKAVSVLNHTFYSDS